MLERTFAKRRKENVRRKEAGRKRGTRWFVSKEGALGSVQLRFLTYFDKGEDLESCSFLESDHLENSGILNVSLGFEEVFMVLDVSCVFGSPSSGFNWEFVEPEYFFS